MSWKKELLIKKVSIMIVKCVLLILFFDYIFAVFHFV